MVMSSPLLLRSVEVEPLSESMKNRVIVHLGLAELRSEEALAFVTDDEAGGIALFAGTTRRITDDRETIELQYEAYEEMALSEMEKLARKALATWPLRKVYLAHRLGRVPKGDVSVLIAVSAPHRAEAFDACRSLIDDIKSRVPIWKKERYADGGQEWVGGTLPDVE